MHAAMNSEVMPLADSHGDSNESFAPPVIGDNDAFDEYIYRCMAFDGGTCWTLKDGREVRCVTRHIDQGMAKLHKYCVRLEKMEADRVYIPVVKKGIIRVKPEGLGLFYNAMHLYLSAYRPFYSYSEYLEAAFELAMEFRFIENGRLGEMFDAFLVQTPESIDYCDRYFQALYDIYQSAAFREKLRNRRRQSEKIIERLKQLIYKLFYIDNLSRLCVIRLDLEYMRESPELDVNPYFLQGKPNELAVDIVQGDLQRFLNTMRGLKLFKDKLAGYAWRMQFGEGAGYHFHVILFLDGNKAFRDLRYAKAAIGLWKRVVGPSARAWSSNFKKKQFLDQGKAVGVGMIHRNDPEKVKALRNVAAYLAHQDQLLNVKAGKASKTFGCSKIGEIDEDLFQENERLFACPMKGNGGVAHAEEKTVDAEALEYRKRGRMRGMAKVSPVIRSVRGYKKDKGLPLTRKQRAGAKKRQGK